MAGGAMHGVVIYGPACDVEGLLNDARIGTDAVTDPASFSSGRTTCATVTPYTQRLNTTVRTVFFMHGLNEMDPPLSNMASTSQREFCPSNVEILLTYEFYWIFSIDHVNDINLYISIGYVSFIITWAKLSTIVSLANIDV
jgi:hypothetical protein